MKTPQSTTTETMQTSLPGFILITFLVSSLCLSTFGKAVGQSPSSVPTLRSIITNSSASPKGVEERLDALIRSTKRAREERQSETEDNIRHAADTVQKFSRQRAPVDPPIPRETDAQPSPTAAQTPSRSMSEIHDRIRILQRLRRDRISKERVLESIQAEGITEGSVFTEPTLTPNEPTAPTNPQRLPAQNTEDLQSIEDSLNAKPAAMDVEEFAPSAPAEPDKPVTAQRIMANPVNPFALGQSLYRTRNYESALKAFQSVDTESMSQSDRTWLDLLTALCQRKLGDDEKAEGTLREIANETSTDYPVKAAKWWLKHTEKSSGTRVKIDELSAEVESLLERSRAYVNP